MMFVFGQDNIMLTIAAIIATWAIISFMVVAIWIVSCEIGQYFTRRKMLREEKKAFDNYFAQIEELRNDFS